MELSITLIVVIITALVSLGAFNNQKMMDDLIFYPPAVSQRNQWYRFFSCGLIHADWGHLIFNMQMRKCLPVRSLVQAGANVLMKKSIIHLLKQGP